MHFTTLERAGETDAALPPIAARPAAPAFAHPGITVSLTVHRSVEPVERLWRALEADQSCPIHQTFEWCRAWVATTGIEVAIVDLRIGGEPAWLLPLEIARIGGIRVARHIATRFSNINNGIFTEAGRKSLADPATRDAAVRALRGAELGADCIVLDKVPLQWRGRPHPLAALPHYASQNAAFQISLDASFEQVVSRTNAKRKRKKYRRATRRLDELGGWRHVIADTQDEAAELLETFFRQKGERLRAQGLADVFEPQATRNFMRTLARRIPDAGNTHPLQMHAIRLEGVNAGAICAVAGLSLKGDHFACQFASIDDSLCPDISPGELLFHLMIERSCAAGAALFDLGVGDQRYKRSWCDVETPHVEIVLPLTLRGRLYAGLRKAVVTAKHGIKHNPRAYAIACRLRGLGVRRSTETKES